MRNYSGGLHKDVVEFCEFFNKKPNEEFDVNLEVQILKDAPAPAHNDLDLTRWIQAMSNYN